jgi:hypothetical protein
MVASLVFYVGLIVAFLGTISVAKPLAFLGIATRVRGGVVAGGGLLIAVAVMIWPAPELRVSASRHRLDEFMPEYQFYEYHSIRVAAPRDRVYRAINEVTADEIPLFLTLTWIRRLGQPGRESVLNAPQSRPLLDVAIRSGFLKLAEEPEREIVVGTLVAAPPGWRPKAEPTPDVFKALHAPGFALAAMNFRLEDAGPNACEVTTETRIYATDLAAAKKFARYWRVIYPGSALIRRMWLVAIRRRAEASR